MRSAHLGGEAGLEKSMASGSAHPGPQTQTGGKGPRKGHYPVARPAQPSNLPRPSHKVGSGSKLCVQIQHKYLSCPQTPVTSCPPWLAPGLVGRDWQRQGLCGHLPAPGSHVQNVRSCGQACAGLRKAAPISVLRCVCFSLTPFQSQINTGPTRRLPGM